MPAAASATQPTRKVPNPAPAPRNDEHVGEPSVGDAIGDEPREADLAPVASSSSEKHHDAALAASVSARLRCSAQYDSFER